VKPLSKDDPVIAAITALPTEKKGNMWEGLNMIHGRLFTIKRALERGQKNGLVADCTVAKVEALMEDVAVMTMATSGMEK
jgi:hypothetical protein